MAQPFVLVSKYGKTGATPQTLQVRAGGTHTLPELLESELLYQSKRYKDKDERDYSLQINVTGKDEAELHQLISSAVNTGHAVAQNMQLVALKTTVTRRARAVARPPQQAAAAGAAPAGAVGAIGVGAAGGGAGGAGVGGGPGAGAAAADEDDEDDVPRGFAQLGRHDVQALTSLMRALTAPVQQALAQQPSAADPVAVAGAAVVPGRQLQSNMVHEALQDPALRDGVRNEFNRIAATYNGGTAVAADLFTQVNMNIGLGQVMGSLLDADQSDQEVARAVLTFIQQNPDEKVRLLSTLTLSDMVQRERPGVARELLLAAQQQESGADRPLSSESSHQLQLQLMRLDVLNVQKQLELSEQRRRDEAVQLRLQQQQRDQQQAQRDLQQLQMFQMLQAMGRRMHAAEESDQPAKPVSPSLSARDVSMPGSRAASPALDDVDIKVKDEPLHASGAASAAASASDAGNWTINVEGEHPHLVAIDVAHAPEQLAAGVAQLRNLGQARSQPGASTHFTAQGQSGAVNALMGTTLGLGSNQAS